METPVSLGESGDFSASAVTSALLSSMLLFLHTSANIVTAQSAKAIKESSNAVGPLSVPPAAVDKSQTTLWVRWLSVMEQTFSTHVAFALTLGKIFTSLLAGGFGFKTAVLARYVEGSLVVMSVFAAASQYAQFAFFKQVSYFFDCVSRSFQDGDSGVL